MSAQSLMKSGSLFFPEAVTAMGPRIDLFYSIIFYGGCIFTVAVVLILFLFIKKYRRTPENPVAIQQITHNDALEITWTVIPFIIVVFIFYFGYKDYLELVVPPENAQEIKVTGKKWMWQFYYPKENKTLLNEVVVPVSQPIKFTMTSDDVIHSFFVPNFRIKKDVVPNRYTRLWFKAEKVGTYQVFCTEFCGDGHSNMLAVIRVLSQEDYEKWLTESDTASSDMPLDQLGKVLYEKKACNACHSIDGSSLTGPSFKGSFGKPRGLASGASVVMDENYIRESIMNPTAKVVKGYPPVMPAFAGLLSTHEVDALIEFIKAQK